MVSSESGESGGCEDGGLSGDGTKKSREVVDVEDCVGEEGGDDTGCEEERKREGSVRRVEGAEGEGRENEPAR